MAIVKNTSTLDQINEVALKRLIPKINEQIFKANPIMSYMRDMTKNTWKMRAYDVYRVAKAHGYKNPYRAGVSSTWQPREAIW